MTSFQDLRVSDDGRRYVLKDEIVKRNIRQILQRVAFSAYMGFVTINYSAHEVLSSASLATVNEIRPEYSELKQEWKDFGDAEEARKFSLGVLIPGEFLESLEAFSNLSNKTESHMYLEDRVHRD